METIKSAAEINRLFSSGRRYGSPYFSIIVEHEGIQHGSQGRAAFIAGKKHGNAVWRNRAKRRLRALYKDLGGPFENYNVILIARSSINEASYEDLLRAGEQLIKRARIR